MSYNEQRGVLWEVMPSNIWIPFYIAYVDKLYYADMIWINVSPQAYIERLNPPPPIFGIWVI